MRRRRSTLLGPDGRPLEPPTLLDVALEVGADERLVPIMEVLSRRNNLLEDDVWKTSPVLDARGCPYLRVVK